ncbi:MAG TPA: PEP/pyruvate-binding domain-containing protein [Bacteroidales bacterium]|nr:PEP/pyruvate-binding domain-containing protein [Bacteroidales bacterium]HRZ48513.1 PEP/pyruvate-binding domain-containing protein [Bacteroidales bacterium]
MKPVLHGFSSDLPAGSAGSKAERLAQMYREGFEVPFGVVLLPDAWEDFLAFHPEKGKEISDWMQEAQDPSGVSLPAPSLPGCELPPALEEQLDEAFELLTQQGFGKLAVRSSGTLEDGGKTSFAGQFDTLLGIENSVQLHEAVLRCWESRFGERLVFYCRHNAIPISEVKMAVILQGQVDADFSGVVFTANPMTGNDREMVIEAVCGMGEQMVQGSVTPFRFHYDWYHNLFQTIHEGTNCRKETQEPAARMLPEDRIRQLGDICLEIQQFFGEPLDIEWAYANGRFHILQARPLTAIHYETPYEWTNADLKDGGISSTVTTPMMYSLYKMTFEHTMPKYLRDIRVLTEKITDQWFTWWFGYCYWNITGAKESLKKLPNFEERAFDEGLGIDPAYEGKGYVSKLTPATLFRGLRALMATNRSIRRRPALCRENSRKVREMLLTLEGTDLHSLPLKDLLLHFNQLIREQYVFAEGSYFYTIYDNSNAATFFQEALAKYNRKNPPGVNYLNLITGLSNLSHLRPVYDLWDISRKALKEPFYQSVTSEKLTRMWLHREAFPMSDDLGMYLQKHGHHSYRELDISIPNWAEDPHQVMELLLQMASQPNEADPRKASSIQQQKFQEERSRIRSPKLLKKLALHRHLLWWREEMRDLSSRMYHQIRRTLLVLGEKMVLEGILQQPGDIFFLTFEEWMATGLIARQEALRSTIGLNRCFYTSFRNFDKPNEILKRHREEKRLTKPADGKILQGIAGSPGQVRGVARVIGTVYEAAALQPGEILVTQFTDPAWTAYFNLISGLVTETGGILSHGAVVSREYGIPAVLGMTGATRLIRTGDVIEVDGNQGIVTFIQ